MTPIMRELPAGKQRITKIHVRGDWLNLGAEVKPGVPGYFHSLPKDVPANRLALAHWLIDAKNPLTGRVAVNRYWEQIFGVGLVETPEDFGMRSKLPVHPELLDWLAVEFTTTMKWDVKKLIKLMVTSAAYRQSSKVTPEMQQRDPDNRLFGRGPRFRSSAETVRDQALFVSGLLSPKMFGPSVRPPQPQHRPERGLRARDRLGHQHRRRQISPGPVHLLAAHDPLSVDDHVRRPESQCLPGGPAADQHAACRPW